MKATAVAVLALIGCSSSSNPGSGSLEGNWFYATSDGTMALGLTFRSDGTYEASDLTFTSSSAANAEVETGTFAASGGTITFTPQEWSCAQPYPAYSYAYAFSGSDLSLSSSSSGDFVLQPETAVVSTTYALTIGCFNSTGAFTAGPLAAVSN